jgi:drug/metabolite transporter (DMT)-like permease
MAVVFLDEEITALQLLGIMVVVSSIVYLEVMSQRSSNISV